MNALAVRTSPTSRWMPRLLLSVGTLLLVGTWVAMYWSESLFTESHLVGYYCCVEAQDLPAVGTVERTLSDFFRASPGRHLVPLILVGANGGLFASRILKARQKAWLPFLFVLLNVVYLLAGFRLVEVSWAISEWVVGPVTGAYRGYDRTWYGIVWHCILWGIFFWGTARASLLAVPREQR